MQPSESDALHLWFILKNGRRFVASIISRPSAFAAVPIGGAMSFCQRDATSIVTPGVTALLPISITARFSTKPEKEWEHERLQARATQLIAADTRSEADALSWPHRKSLKISSATFDTTSHTVDSIS